MTVEDLYQSGYLALVDAVKSYDAGRGKSFIGWLALVLKTAFNDATGQRSERQRRDPLHQALSIDAIIPDSDGLTIGDGLEAPCAVMAFNSTDFSVFLGQCRTVIAAALNTLPDNYAELLRRYYLQRRSIDKAAAAGYSGRATAYEAMARALYRLAHGPYTKALRECLDTFTEFEEYQGAVRSAGIGSFRHTGTSSTEAGALLGGTYGRAYKASGQSGAVYIGDPEGSAAGGSFPGRAGAAKSGDPPGACTDAGAGE